MKLLHFASPKVVSTHFKRVLRSARQYNEGYWKLIPFLVLRAFAVIIGLDSCIVKLVQVNAQMNAYVAASSSNHAGPDENATYSVHPVLVWLACVNFLRQVLGIVQANRHAQERLFHFVFAGEDSIMDKYEKAVMKTWEAQLAKQIWNCGKYSLVDRLVLMLTFSDDDFQRLVLDESVSP